MPTNDSEQWRAIRRDVFAGHLLANMMTAVLVAVSRDPDKCETHIRDSVEMAVGMTDLLIERLDSKNDNR